MPNLSIKNVPQPLVDKLRRRAALNHRSLQGELMALVKQTIDAEVDAFRPLSPRAGGTKTIEQIASERLKRWPEPFSNSPQAADLIRAERDER